MPRRYDPWPALTLLGFLALCMLAASSDLLPSRWVPAEWYAYPRSPPGTLPAWVIGLLAAAFQVPTGVAAWRIWCRSPNGWPRIGGGGSLAERAALRRRALQLWGWQLGFSVCWSAAFFLLYRPDPAVLFGGGLLGLSLLARRDFVRVDRVAGLLIAPYVGWLCYLLWLTVGTALLNPI